MSVDPVKALVLGEIEPIGNADVRSVEFAFTAASARCVLIEGSGDQVGVAR
jgi:hypothetical protein